MKYNLEMTKKTLDNGLTVILIHKPDYAKSFFMLSAPVGGADIIQSVNGERVVRRSGLAHYMEHQMFRYDGQDVSELFARMQCSSNAFTTYFDTSYYFQTTADIYEPLKLLLNFVENLDITKDSVEKERGIILSEYDMYDQAPEQRLLKETWISMYHNHPMKVDVLGTPEDISDISVDDLSAFYKQNYDPSRLLLIGITGKEINPIMEWLEENQKAVPSRGDNGIRRIIDKEPDNVVRKEFTEKMDITIPYIAIAYKLKPEKDAMSALKKDTSLQMYLDALFGVKNPDYQKWLDQRIFNGVLGAECDISVDHAYILVYAQTTKQEEFIKIADETIQKLKERSMDNEVFEALKAKQFASAIRTLDRFEPFAIDLMHSYFEKYDYFKSLEDLGKLTAQSAWEDVRNLDLTNRTITQIVPKSSVLTEMD